MTQMAEIVESVGAMTLRPISEFGRFLVFISDGLKRFFFPPLRWSLLVTQLEFVGTRSIGVVIMASIMIGAIFGFQLGEIFRMFGAEGLVGAAAGFTMAKELAPVVSAMLVTGRAGSAMAAEIASMRVNEQIDAMTVMAVNPISYLVAPRIAAAMIMLPLLSAVFVLVGVASSYFIAVAFYNVDVGVFLQKIQWIINIPHVVDGLEKACVFGVLLATIGCYTGFYAGRGAKGVGEATTKAVVVSMLAILISDFFVSFIQYKFK